jgi:2-dehydro-3-deoxyphosphogluconate aldolase/(4S)-4-hydroxy-2-oxoglutarate aldolase
MSAFPDSLLQRLEAGGVVAGFSIERPEHAVPLVRALLAGGIDAVELTLRTAAGLEAVRRISAEVPEILLGVGTILSPQTAVEVQAAGADFGVSPGINRAVVGAALDAGLPFAPGICTPSDVEAAIELGCRFMKFFPAEASRGLGYLRAMAAPYRHLGIRYFPLGGVNADNMLDYLADELVPCVGGSWIVDPKRVAAEDWSAITRSASSVVEALKEA